MSEKQQIPGPKSPNCLIFSYFIFMKLLFKLHWPKQLTEIITTSASKSPLQALQLLQHHQCNAASLRAPCVALQIISMDLICRLKFLMQTRPLIIKKCFHGFICEQAKQLILLLFIPSPSYALAEMFKTFLWASHLPSSL